MSFNAKIGLGAQKIFEAPKNERNLIFWVRKNEKIDFFQKPEFSDLVDHWRWSG